jgi:hypothetical protein
MESETVYALPKDYNGKTVEELFPDFRHDSVPIFSKLFGLGRVSSLPKLWKGTKKRRKNKQQRQQSQTDIYDICTNPPKTQIINQIENDELIELLKPYTIVNEPKVDLCQRNKTESEIQKDNERIAFETKGPASYWYQFDINTDTETTLKNSNRITSNSSFNNKELLEPTLNNLNNNEPMDIDSTNQVTTTIDDTIIDLKSQINQLKSSSIYESFLLVNTIDWEKDIIIETPNINDKPFVELISSYLDSSDNMIQKERCKFAGWIPSNERRTFSSYQSSILNNESNSATILNDAISIFPNNNRNLLNNKWEYDLIDLEVIS